MLGRINIIKKNQTKGKNKKKRDKRKLENEQKGRKRKGSGAEKRVVERTRFLANGRDRSIDDMPHVPLPRTTTPEKV